MTLLTVDYTMSCVANRSAELMRFTERVCGAPGSRAVMPFWFGSGINLNRGCLLQAVVAIILLVRQSLKPKNTSLEASSNHLSVLMASTWRDDNDKTLASNEVSLNEKSNLWVADLFNANQINSTVCNNLG